MISDAKTVGYATINSYETLNAFTAKTKNVWMVFHGIGYLSRYFLAHFDGLPADENYFIAPQAPSKYYLDNRYAYVGASWLTRVDREQETKNVMAYLDAIWQQEKPRQQDVNLIVMGFSQGVSIATRWLAHKQIPCRTLLLYAGGLPKELEATDMAHLVANGTQIFSIIGDSDAFLTPERLKEEEAKLGTLFQGKAQMVRFHGGHEIKKEILTQLVYGS
jgi:predicted esterase